MLAPTYPKQSPSRGIEANEPTTGTAAANYEGLEQLQRLLPPIKTAYSSTILGFPSKMPARLLASPLSYSVSTHTGVSRDSVNGAMGSKDDPEVNQPLSGVTFTPFTGITDGPEPMHRLFQSTDQQQRLAPSSSFHSFQSHPHMHPSPMTLTMGKRETDTRSQRRGSRTSTPNTGMRKLRVQQLQQQLQQQGTPRLGSLGPDDDAAVVITRLNRTITTEMSPDIFSPKAYAWASSDTADWFSQQHDTFSGEYLQLQQGQQYLPTASPAAVYHLQQDATAAWTLPQLQQQQQQVDPGMRCSGCGIAPQQPRCPPASFPTQHLTRLMLQGSAAGYSELSSPLQQQQGACDLLAISSNDEGSFAELLQEIQQVGMGPQAAAAVLQTSSAAGAEQQQGPFSRAVAAAAAAVPINQAAGQQQQQQGVGLDPWELLMCGLLELGRSVGGRDEVGEVLGKLDAAGAGAGEVLGLLGDFSGDWMSELLLSA